jgi:hypothetical protein
MFDLTKEIKLEPEMRKKYNVARILLHIFFLAAVFFVADRILFPSVSLVFSFANSNSLSNTLVSPRTLSSPNSLPKNISANDKFLFNANPLGNFSDASITFTTNGNSNIEGSSVNLRKSFQAFFYPTGAPAGFMDGTLLTTGKGNYYIVSDGFLRKFSDSDVVSKLGYPKVSFLQVSPSDLQYNQIGNDITDADSYPNDSFFAIGETYYELKNQQLFPFISARAFLSQFDATQAIAKNNDFLERYPVSEKPLGFADGTLVSSDISVFILSESKSYPIINASTFIQMGFDWKNVIALDPEELGLYDRQRLFTRDQPHPNGTLFMDRETKKYFIIRNGEKHSIESTAVAKTYSFQNPVIADLKESEENISCQLKKIWLRSNVYSCNIPLGSMASFLGNDYEVSATFVNNVKLSKIETTFSTPFSWQNLKVSLSRIKENLKNNYITPPQ